MEDLFKSFYYPNEKEIKKIWNNKKTLFVLDTNILINLYRYKEETRADFFKLLEQIKEKVFLPHHIILEYQRNRLKTIAAHRSNINKFINAIKTSIDYEELFFQKKESKESQSDIAQKYPDIYAEFKNELKEIDDNNKLKMDALIVKLEQKKEQFPHVNNDDLIRKKLSDMLENIGSPFTQGILDEIYKKGEIRYRHNRAPGFKDSNKDTVFYFNDLRFEQKYGDLIIWEQIKSYVKDKDDIEFVVFISDDSTKDDWFESIDSEGRKLLGARVDLQSEICGTCKNIKKFIIHDSSQFFKLGKDIYKLKIQDQSIDDIKKNNFLFALETAKRAIPSSLKTTNDYYEQYFLGTNNDNDIGVDEQFDSAREKAKIVLRRVYMVDRKIESIKDEMKFFQDKLTSNILTRDEKQKIWYKLKELEEQINNLKLNKDKHIFYLNNSGYS